jgi:hypothetical protein
MPVSPSARWGIRLIAAGFLRLLHGLAPPAQSFSVQSDATGSGILLLGQLDPKTRGRIIPILSLWSGWLRHLHQITAGRSTQPTRPNFFRKKKHRESCSRSGRISTKCLKMRTGSCAGAVAARSGEPWSASDSALRFAEPENVNSHATSRPSMPFFVPLFPIKSAISAGFALLTW